MTKEKPILLLGTEVCLDRSYPGGWITNTLYPVILVKTRGDPHVNADTPVFLGRTGSDKTLEVEYKNLRFPKDAQI
jgi:hypothetical protein